MDHPSKPKTILSLYVLHASSLHCSGKYQIDSTTCRADKYNISIRTISIIVFYFDVFRPWVVQCFMLMKLPENQQECAFWILPHFSTSWLLYLSCTSHFYQNFLPANPSNRLFYFHIKRRYWNIFLIYILLVIHKLFIHTLVKIKIILQYLFRRLTKEIAKNLE